MLKKYIVFIVSFALLYSLYQILSGLVLTALYSPDLSLTDGTASQKAGFGQSSVLQLLAVLFIATLSYFFSNKFINTTS
ncbi:hypothetical protein GCM10009001_34570 [Virgibacillus siamensis]|uniref:Uncharacterized protein n=1 Tax=Virgibacillus siamensis TaxID=480071 RepID=A0ABN1GM50_9BACI